MFRIVSPMAWRQHGVFGFTQATTAGVTSSWLSRQVAQGTLLRPAPRVYALAGAPETARHRLMVHILAAGDGAIATGDSALGLRCPELMLPMRPVLAVPRSCGYRTNAATLIRSRDLGFANAGDVDGVPAAGVARALLDASIGRTPEQVVSLINSCQRFETISINALVECLDAHARRGRTGVATFRAALAMLTDVVPDSEFERLVLADLDTLGLEPRLHHVVRLKDEAPITLDIDFPGARLDLELDGRDHQVRMEQFNRDRQRDRLLQAAGYMVVRYTWTDYMTRRKSMLDELRGFVEARRMLSRRRTG